MSKRNQFRKSSTTNSDEDNMLSELERAMFQRADRKAVQKAVDSGLITVQDNTWYIGRFEIKKTGLQAPETVTEEEYQEFGRVILDIGNRIQWLIGDWIVYGEQYAWGETYARLADEFGYEIKTLYDYAYVCSNVQFSVRTENLSFGHHKLVAAIEDPKEQGKWLGKAEKGTDGKSWSIAEMRQQMKLASGNAASDNLIDRWLQRINQLVESVTDENRLQVAQMLREAANRIEAGQ